MSSPGPTRASADLADVVELLLDKGLVINADIAVSVGDTELLGIQIRAAVASFETAAQYGLEFPEGTDQERIEQVANRNRLGPPHEGRFESPKESVPDTPTAEVPDGERTERAATEAADEAGAESPAGEATNGGSNGDDD
ncbi:gas vesicle protein GvpJ [Haloarcula salina]|uniref:Gas vesicle protein n=1 Tax=Haloarcula salina TaxID=1429914 RepID=A0AA41G206_9EURY|nr:gas vesicle protein [Haloarcula salina]MBV0901938.1 gas vesicle protein [Haloarcula salina]